jgi:hypothetical protein
VFEDGIEGNIKLMEHVKTYFNNLISNSPIITISIVTCFGYLFAYQYEIGTAKYYNIPDYLVQIDLLQVILNAVLMYIQYFQVCHSAKGNTQPRQHR